MNTLPSLLFELIPLYHSRISSKLDWGEEGGLNRSQERALMITARKGELLPSHLGRCLDMKPGSLTPLTDSLVEMGLVCRTLDPQDRRKHWISLTPQGSSLVAAKQAKVEKQIEKVLSSLTGEERSSLEDHLREVTRILSKL